MHNKYNVDESTNRVMVFFYNLRTSVRLDITIYIIIYYLPTILIRVLYIVISLVHPSIVVALLRIKRRVCVHKFGPNSMGWLGFSCHILLHAECTSE